MVRRVSRPVRKGKLCCISGLWWFFREKTAPERWPRTNGQAPFSDREIRALGSRQGPREALYVLLIDPDDSGIHKAGYGRQRIFRPGHVERARLVVVQVRQHFQPYESHGERP